MKRWISPRELHRLGIAGMNQRNGEYIAKLNPRSRYPLVDDKILTKELAIKAGVAVPELYGVIHTHRDIRSLGAMLQDKSSFVIKPVHGSGGSGILVFNGKDDKGAYRRANGRMMSAEALAHHVSNILAGAYSLGGRPDTAMIEQRVEFSQAFEHLSYQGVPDTRIIVYRGCPAMAMIRLPTRHSDGKANLHQGAIGTGIDLETGHTTAGVWLNQHITHHPDTEVAVAGHMIPDWDIQLRLSSRCYDLTELGYLGVDLVLDANHGPMLLELNARPGLAIQIANQEGLHWRTRAIDHWLEERAENPPTADERAHWFAEKGLRTLIDEAAARG
ncbi:alpha-L-glutamate ligase-like protein [Paenalcaligenes sp. Me131]|uniref:alpha-L-glutamate ligase-like protein n=1 Tax=Paenalcaligenes sp. Me131 TaxID=3392636 RepID=UPI003D29DFE6